jgi:carbamate kinase
VVPSPHPYSIVEGPVIRGLVGDGVIVIASGGGGVPVVEEGPRLVGVEAVVDKDLAAAILAKDVEADTLLILTDVAGVFEGYGTPEQRLLPQLTVADARRRVEAGELGSGSMGPKVEAAVKFVESGGARAVIAALADGVKAVQEEAGTRVVA